MEFLPRHVLLGPRYLISQSFRLVKAYREDVSRLKMQSEFLKHMCISGIQGK
jgi:hypothetical protein